MSISSKNVIAAARKAHKRNPGCKWRDFYRGFLEGFGWMLTHKSQKDAARLLAYIADQWPISMTRKERNAVDKVIRKQFPKYDPSVDPWPACLGEMKGTR